MIDNEVRQAFEAVFECECPRELLEAISPDSRVTYVSDYTTEGIAQTVQSAKDGNLDSLDKMAREMARYVSEGDTLVPVPGESGRATVTLELAKRIGWLSGAHVADLLVGRESGEGKSLELVREPPGHVLLVDTAVGEGETMKEALEKIPGSRGLAYAVDPGKYAGQTT